jgi:hypothetical protein
MKMFNPFRTLHELQYLNTLTLFGVIYRYLMKSVKNYPVIIQYLKSVVCLINISKNINSVKSSG